jgi:pimeloyl-ACP methyl ester carboxylesterase
MTTFGLVHGAWHDATCWEQLRPLLEERGHAVVTPTLPCDDVAASFSDYADVAVAALADAGDDVVLVGHSLGSETIPIVAARRPVRLLVYLTPSLQSLPRPEGQPTVTRDGLHVPMDGDGRSTWEEDEAVRQMYARLEPGVARTLARALRPQAMTFGGAAYPLDAAPDVPAAMIYTTDDELLRPEYARWAAEHVLGVEPIELPGGHFPMVERPEEVAELLVGLAERAGAPVA